MVQGDERSLRVIGDGARVSWQDGVVVATSDDKGQWQTGGRHRVVGPRSGTSPELPWLWWEAPCLRLTTVILHRVLELDDTHIPVTVSDGCEMEARRVLSQVSRAREWASLVLDRDVEFALVVADEHDWASVAAVPIHLPHAATDRIVVPARPTTAFGESLRTYWPHIDDERRRALTAAYGEALDTTPFVELIVVHELGHLFHLQVPFEFDRFWLTEFFANLLMVGYVAEVQPQMWPQVEHFAAAASSSPPLEGWAHALDDMELSLQVGPENYIWYQMILIDRAIAVWHSSSKEGMRRLFDECRTPDSEYSALTRTLASIDPQLTQVMYGWPAP